jgi:phosphoglycerate dehydrogenase-like enzyme
MPLPERLFQIYFTGDFYQPDGSPLYKQFGLSVLDAQPNIRHQAFRENLREIETAQIGDAQAVIVLSPRVTARSLSRSENLLAVGRFGVGYDSVDVPACTAADVALVTAVGAVDRAVAEATVGWRLALTHHMRAKDRLVREGHWHQRSLYMGKELRQRTLGIIGLGGIGRALIELLRGFGMNPPLAFDPFLDPQAAQRIGVTLVPLDELMAKSDFVSIHCPLSEKTRNLVGTRQLGLMKSDAYLINTARGGIVDEDALYETLRSHRIAGAALDCFVGEPLTEAHRFGHFEHVILAPHSIAWTDEMFRDIGDTICRAMVELDLGRRPPGVINPDVLERPGFQQKWARLRIA